MWCLWTTIYLKLMKKEGDKTCWRLKAGGEAPSSSNREVTNLAPIISINRNSSTTIVSYSWYWRTFRVSPTYIFRYQALLCYNPDFTTLILNCFAVIKPNWHKAPNSFTLSIMEQKGPKIYCSTHSFWSKINIWVSLFWIITKS